MAKRINLKSGLSSVLFWSIISAAFIGPGTVTTASKAGASFGLDLMWALSFSILATILLQEAAARITIASGKSLGTVIAEKYAGKKGHLLKIFLFSAVVIGCAAYQAGNILGALSGIFLVMDISKVIPIISIGLLAGSLLWSGKYRLIANFMGVVVALMGIIFIIVAFNTDHSALNIFSSIVVPKWSSEANLLIIGLIGTTIVPYNLFLASGISKGQGLNEMRIGLISAILIGGIISIAILVVGTQVEGTFSFQSLADTLASKLGPWSGVLFGFGLFAAGLTSTITAPLAAAVTAQSLFGSTNTEKWKSTGHYFRIVWGGVLLFGLLFSLTDIKPIPAIIAAQALNGLLLPIIAVFLVLTMNDEALLGKQYVNSFLTNILMLIVLLVSCFLGFNNVFKAFQKILPDDSISTTLAQTLSLVLSVVVILFVGIQIFRKKVN